MAGKKERKKLESEKALAAFRAKVGDKELTAQQQAEETRLENAVKAEKFKVQGKKHIDSILNKSTALCRLANAKKYAYTPEQVEKIGSALTNAFESIKGAFAGKKVTGGIEL